MPRPATDSVRRHYTALAPRYNQGANAACNRRYEELLSAAVGKVDRVLEAGAGAHSVLPMLAARQRVACDLTMPMLQQAPRDLARVVCDAHQPPFRAAHFDAVVSVNVLEHVAEPTAMLVACSALLRTGGRMALITPNGDYARLLELLERLRLKLPEGPHRFVGRVELRDCAEAAGLRVIALRPVLASPAGPPGWVRLMDAIGARMGFGLFLFCLLEKANADGAVNPAAVHP